MEIKTVKKNVETAEEKKKQEPDYDEEEVKTQPEDVEEKKDKDNADKQDLDGDIE